MKKIGTKTYPNGTKYKGEIDKEGHPHGKGTMIFPKQFTYIHKGKKYISNVLISSWGKKNMLVNFFMVLCTGKVPQHIEMVQYMKVNLKIIRNTGKEP